MIETISKVPSLASRLRERILADGPITFCDWMRAALYDPDHGYYCRADATRWGRQGDYRTSPERSSLFASTLARYFARLYEDLGAPSKWTIFEAGAGDGSFASSVLQTLERSFPEIFTATFYVIDEVSSQSRSLARKRLAPFAGRVEFRKLADVEIDPGVVFSNELLDAFPVHRVTMQRNQLLEFYVSVLEDGTFGWLLGEPPGEGLRRLLAYFDDYGIELGEGQVADVNLEIEEWLRVVAERMRNGYLVTVDYGKLAEDLYSTANQNGTLRGIQRHQFVADLLARPGDHDLTATVNWSLVKSAGASLGLETVEFEQQDKFLLNAGLLEQFELESQQCKDEAERLRLSTAAREMILPGGMASHFQVLVQKKIS